MSHSQLPEVEAIRQSASWKRARTTLFFLLGCLHLHGAQWRSDDCDRRALGLRSIWSAFAVTAARAKLPTSSVLHISGQWHTLLQLQAAKMEGLAKNCILTTTRYRYAMSTSTFSSDRAKKPAKRMHGARKSARIQPSWISNLF